ncbi:MAG: UvrD-helicase domain-containing protein [Patescibacteria group bacterium]
MTTESLVTTPIDHETERQNDLSKVLNSVHKKRVVVAGPGTGKSFLFERVIRKEKKEGKSKFLALTFMGKLCDELADDLAGLAETRTIHSFARKFVIDLLGEGWIYFPQIYDVIAYDLSLQGLRDVSIDSKEYLARSNYYKAIGDKDAIHYALKLGEKFPEKIPSDYDLILVDEYQDLNETEDKFIDLLATKNNILIVGDDDQALYDFKGSFSKFIREKYKATGEEYLSTTLRFCSRCTDVIINAFHRIANAYGLNNLGNERIKKEYLCYTPGKKEDNEANPSIILLQNVVPADIANKIIHQLSELLERQKIKSVLVIGEARTCKYLLPVIAEQLRYKGFKHVDNPKLTDDVYKLKTNIIEGLKLLKKSPLSTLAWRLMIESLDEETRKSLILISLDEKQNFINSIPEDFKKTSEKIATTHNGLTKKSKSERTKIANSSIASLEGLISSSRLDYREILTNQLREETNHLPRPLANLEIAVTSILLSKGLGADVVFLIGFDQGKLPTTSAPDESEIYQMLVALTRTKKRLYLINTKDKPTSCFINSIGKDNYEVI